MRTLYPELQEYIRPLMATSGNISPERKQRLRIVSDYIARFLLERGDVSLQFICTHNSRRSHFAQIWAAVAAYVTGLESVKTYSGGTEATAFHPNAVGALLRAGFRMGLEDPAASDINPKINMLFSPDAPPLVCYSKTLDGAVPDGAPFAAVMTCSDADEHCPLVPGAELRQAVTFEDPKQADGTAFQDQVYDERCREIAGEMFWMMQEAKSSIQRRSEGEG